MDDLFGKEDALELDDKEIDELLDILQGRFKGLPRNCVVFFGSEGGSQALGEDKLPSDLSRRSDYFVVSATASIHSGIVGTHFQVPSTRP